MLYNVLIPDNVDHKAIERLERNDVFSVNAPGQMGRDETLVAIGDADALIIRSSTTVDAELLAQATQLKAIARAGVGVDNVDLAAATAQNVVVMNTPHGNIISTAEFTLGLMLSLARHIPQGHGSLGNERWDRKLYTGIELRDKTLGVIGFGRIGRAVAQRAQAFEMTVIAHDPFIPKEVATSMNVKLVSLDELYEQADFISLHAVITDETCEMICAESIIKMKPGVRIINAARGALINEADLASAIQHGHVAGAALDVYRQEPPGSDNPLIGLNNVIHTPHLAASTRDAQVQVGIDAAQQIIDGLSKGDFRNVVNPDVLKTLQAS